MDDGEPVLGRGQFRAHWRTITFVAVALAGMAVLAALVATISATNHERDRALRLQSHSFEVMILARALSGTISEAEASLGRYVISADKSLGRLYADQWRRAGSELARLEQVTRDNAAQARRVAALRTAYAERGRELDLVALNTSYGRNDTALSRYWQAREGEARQSIESLLEAAIDGERRLLDLRTAAAGASLNRANRIVAALVGLGVLVVLGLIALGWLTVEVLAERAVTRGEADAARERSDQLERAVAAATAELREQARERAQAEAQLRQVQKMEAVGQLTGGIAHDFNNMLAVVLGGLELARRAVRSDPIAATRHIDSAVDGAGRAAALTRRLLAFAREEALLPEAVEAGALIGGMSDLLDRTLGDGVKVVTSDEGVGWRTWVDRHQLENALLNLAVNARDAMDGRGTLTIATGGTALAAGALTHADGGDYVTIAVSDTGHGMAADVLERVFEPFYTTKPVGKGTGLGLSQIFGFVRQSQGDIAISSTPDQGTTVTLYLPRHRGPVAVPAPMAAPLAVDVADGDGLDILVVEDDPRVLAATVDALEELGHRPVGCGDPLDAPAAAAAMARCDLVMTDVLMPARTGPELIAILRDHLPQTGVLFVTGYAGEVAGVDFNGHAVLRKPYTLAGLERAVADAMAEVASAAPIRLAS